MAKIRRTARVQGPTPRGLPHRVPAANRLVSAYRFGDIKNGPHDAPLEAAL